MKDNKLKKGEYAMKVFKISHLVKSEDLNHHGTLFAWAEQLNGWWRPVS